jgi:hypothetical protein
MACPATSHFSVAIHAGSYISAQDQRKLHCHSTIRVITDRTPMLLISTQAALEQDFGE